MKKNWTIIMQISAESNLFDEMINVMQEIYDVKLGELSDFADVNFIAVFDGIKAGKFSNEFAKPAIYQVCPNSSFLGAYPITKINNRPINEDLSNKRTLTRIYNFIKKQYPALNYGYIYKGHGGPATGDISSGVFFEKMIKLPDNVVNDEAKLEEAVKNLARGWTYSGVYKIAGYMKSNVNDNYVMVLFSRKSKKSLTYRAMSEVLEKVFTGKEKLNFIFLDCCWGMQLENAYTFRNATDYFIASADEMPAAGIGYTDFITKIVTRPQILGKEISNLLLSIYFTNRYDDYDSDVKEFREMGVSLTNVKTADIDHFIGRFNKFCDYLVKDMQTFGPLIKKARECCKDYTYVNPREYAVFNIDLIWFLENLMHFNNLTVKDKDINNFVFELTHLLVVRVRYGYLGNNYKDVQPGTLELGGKGITITFPENRELFDESIFVTSNKARPLFIQETSWRRFLLGYYSFIEQALADTTNLIDHHKANLKKNKGFLEMFEVGDMEDADVGTKLEKFLRSTPDPKGKSKWGEFVSLKGQV